MESFGAGVLRGQMVRLRNRVKILKYEVLELCCSEWFQNNYNEFTDSKVVLELCCSEWFQNLVGTILLDRKGFRAVLF